MSKTAKVLIVESTSKLGGAQFDDLLIQQESQSQIQYVTVCAEDGDLVQKIHTLGNEVSVLKTTKQLSTSCNIKGTSILNPFALLWRVLSLPIDVVRLSLFIKHNNVDVVVTNSMTAHIYGGISALFAKRPLVFRLMDVIRKNMLKGYGRKLFYWFAKILGANVVVPSMNVAVSMFPNKFITESVTVIYNATDCNDFNLSSIKPSLQSEYECLHNKLIFGCYSRLVPWKGHKIFITALSKVVKIAPNVFGVIVGGKLWGEDSYVQELIKLAKSLNVYNKGTSKN